MDVFAVVLLVFVLVLASLFWGRAKQHSHLPPGPRTLPLIGNMLQLVGKDLRQVCKEYRKIYGNVFTLRIFNRTLIIINGFDTLKDFAVRNGGVFSDRPQIDVLNAAMKGRGIAFANGQMWKHNRRFILHTLKGFGMENNKLQSLIHEEISCFLDVLDKEQEQPFDIEYYVTIAISNIMCSLVFGRRFDYTDEEFVDIIGRLGEIFAAPLSTNPLWLRWVPGDPFFVARSLRKLKHIRNFYRRKVQDHNRDFDACKLRDVIDAYIKQMRLGRESSLLNEDEIVRIVHELFVTGTETTSTALRFALIFMLRDQDVQEKLASELTEFLPDTRLPDMNDMKNLPYLQAFISETLRRASMAPFAVPHATETDRQYRGYTIPKTATILLNLESVLHDEALWTNPLEFNPSRFITGNTLLAERKEQIPFGIGPRECPGQTVAQMELSLFLSAMVQRFKFFPPEGEDPPSLVTKLGVTSAPLPFKLRAIKRAV